MHWRRMFLHPTHVVQGLRWCTPPPAPTRPVGGAVQETTGAPEGIEDSGTPTSGPVRVNSVRLGPQTVHSCPYYPFRKFYRGDTEVRRVSVLGTRF